MTCSQSINNKHKSIKMSKKWKSRIKTARIENVFVYRNNKRKTEILEARPTEQN